MWGVSTNFVEQIYLSLYLPCWCASRGINCFMHIGVADYCKILNKPYCECRNFTYVSGDLYSRISTCSYWVWMVTHWKVLRLYYMSFGILLLYKQHGEVKNFIIGIYDTYIDYKYSLRKRSI